MGVLSVSILGSVRAHRGGTSHAIGSRRQRALLAALAVRFERAVSVNDLVDAVWDDPPIRARATLQTYVSRLRGTLGEDAILYGPAGYRLAPGTEVDMAQARAALADGREAVADDPAHAAAVAAWARDLWDGTALAEFADHEWFAPVATGLEELRANLDDLLAEALVVGGRPIEAIELLETIVRSNPFREPAQLLLIRALADAGRQTDALRAADRYRSRLRDETGLDPGNALAELEQRILAGEVPRRTAPPAPAPAAAPAAAAPVAPSAPSGATLARPSRLIGRAAELDALRAHLRDHRLVTVLGVGGVGKTRLVAELTEHLEQHDHPADAGRDAPLPRPLAVELAPVAEDDVAATVGAALGYRADRPEIATVVELLRSEELVLVLDNCEHVLGAVRDLVRAVVAGCPRVRVLATSRTRLGLADEQLFALEPLGTDGARAPSIELFAERVQRAHPRTDLDPTDPAVRVLCERLDGLPLALELAAGRAALLSVDTLLARLDSALDLLSVPEGSDASRHASLRSVVAWSHELLSAPARRLLAVLSVFDGEFDLAAAEVVGASVTDEPVPLLFGRLIDTCLVAPGGTTGHFRLLEMIRQYGAEQLAGTDDETAARHAHVRWVARTAAAIAADATGPNEAATSARFDALRPDVRSAVRWASATGDGHGLAALLRALAGPLLYRPDAEVIALVRSAARRAATDWSAPVGGTSGAGDPVDMADIAAAAARAGFLAGELADAAALADRALELAGGGGATATSARSRANHALGVLGLYQGRLDDAARGFEAVTTDPAADIVDRLDALGGLALALCYADRWEDARAVALEHRAIADAVDSDTYRAFADYVDGEVELATGDIDHAVAHLTTGAERAWQSGAAFVWGLASTVLGAVLVRHRPGDEARAQLPTLLRRWRRTATWPQLWTSLRLVAEVLARDGADDVAALVLAAADLDPAATELVGDDLTRDRALRDALRERLGPATFAGITASARAVDRVDVLERAIATLEGVPAS